MPCKKMTHFHTLIAQKIHGLHSIEIFAKNYDTVNVLLFNSKESQSREVYQKISGKKCVTVQFKRKLAKTTMSEKFGKSLMQQKEVLIPSNEKSKTKTPFTISESISSRTSLQPMTDNEFQTQPNKQKSSYLMAAENDR